MSHIDLSIAILWSNTWTGRSEMRKPGQSAVKFINRTILARVLEDEYLFTNWVICWSSSPLPPCARRRLDFFAQSQACPAVAHQSEGGSSALSPYFS